MDIDSDEETLENGVLKCFEYQEVEETVKKLNEKQQMIITLQFKASAHRVEVKIQL